MSRLDFDIMNEHVVDFCVDHDVYVTKTKVEKPEVKMEELRERDVPQTQIQIVSI